MDPRIARRAAASALIAGIGADILFDRIGLGINVPIATVAALALVTWLGPHHRPGDPLDWWLPGVAVAASLGPALRTDPSVIPLDLGLIAIATAAWSLAVSGIAVTRRTATAVVALAVEAGVISVIALAWLATRSGADGFFSRGLGQLGRAAPLVRGALIAIPVLAGFSALLGSADAVFGRALDDALRFPIDLGDLLGRGVFSIIAAGLIAGPVALAVGARDALRLAVVDTEAGSNGGAAPPAGEPAAGDTPIAQQRTAATSRPGATEALVVLGAVDLLFAAFAVVQVVYLFGGVDTLAVVGMTYSDYARQGYFQLVGVVALAGLLLLGAHEVVGRTRGFLAGAIALVVLTAVILASAAFRLALYQGAYGWTELRFFVAASIGWLALCLGLAGVLLLANRMRWLPHGLAMSAAAVTLAVTAIGPQAFVMHENLARVLDPRLVAPGGSAGFDVEYGLTLGDDAIPELVAALDALPLDERIRALEQLRYRRLHIEVERDAERDEPTAILAWNLARERARAALEGVPGR